MDQDKTLATLGQEWVRRGLKRRDFLRLTGAGVSAAAITGILAACGAEPTATPAPAPTATKAAAASAAPSAAASAAPSAAASAAPSAAASAAGAAATPAASAAASASARPSTAASAAPSTTASASPSAGTELGYPSGGKYSSNVAVGKTGGTMVEVAFADGRTNNPMLTSDTSSSARINMQFNALVNLNPDTGLTFPDLATAVPTRANGGISADGLTYTFKLRNDVKWHDGVQFNSKDVVFTYKTMANKDLTSPRTADINARIDSVTAPDDYTVVFKLKNVVAPFLTDNMYNIVPEHILASVPVAEIKQHPFSTGDAKASIGTGPFKFGEWVKDDHFTLVKNAAYFRGPVALDKYIFKVVKDANVVVASLKTGEGDYGAITNAFWDEMQKQANVNAVKYDTYSFTFYGYQLDATKTTIFQDKEVRQALMYALDRDAMVQAILLNLGVPAQGTMPTLSFAYQPDKLKTKYTYDPKKAEALLDAAGWKKGADGIRAKDGKKLQFTLWTNSGNKTREQYVTVMQQQWKAIGVDATPKTEEFSVFVTRITETHDFEMFLVGFSWGVDPDQATMWKADSYSTGGFNTNKYSNKQVDTLCDQGLTELDTEKRKAIYLDLQNIIMDEIPSGILDFPQATVAVNKRVKNFFPNAINVRWNAHLYWVEDGK